MPTAKADKPEKPDRSTYTPADFLDWRESGTLILTPKFQRRGIWKMAARSFFIDTLIRGMPIPPVYIRVTQGKSTNRPVREVVDGQQRIAAVLDYMTGGFRLSRSLDSRWGGKMFAQLDEEYQQSISNYTFSAELFRGISDAEVLEIFSRLNTYSVPLNAQELRNGKYFGLFKQLSYSLAHRLLEYWRTNGIFSEQAIARMQEVELVSELLVAYMVGMQDKKRALDDHYRSYDEEFKDRGLVEKRFLETFREVTVVFADGLAESEFRRRPLLYTLFCVIYHRRYGLPGVTEPTPKKLLGEEDRASLREAVATLSEHVQNGRAGEPVAKSHQKFVSACLNQTDNIQPRKERFSHVYKLAFRREA